MCRVDIQRNTSTVCRFIFRRITSIKLVIEQSSLLWLGVGLIVAVVGCGVYRKVNIFCDCINISIAFYAEDGSKEQGSSSDLLIKWKQKRRSASNTVYNKIVYIFITKS